MISQHVSIWVSNMVLLNYISWTTKNSLGPTASISEIKSMLPKCNSLGPAVSAIGWYPPVPPITNCTEHLVLPRSHAPNWGVLIDNLYILICSKLALPSQQSNFHLLAGPDCHAFSDHICIFCWTKPNWLALLIWNCMLCWPYRSAHPRSHGLQFPWLRLKMFALPKSAGPCRQPFWHDMFLGRTQN